MVAVISPQHLRMSSIPSQMTYSVINTANNSVVATIRVGRSPSALAITPNEAFAYVANSNAKSVSVIKTATPLAQE